MDLEQTLELLKRHGVGSATFDGAGGLTSVTFAVPYAQVAAGGGDGDDEHDDEEPGWRTVMHRAAGVLQGRERSMREDRNDA
jgi:hypothetical protein